MKKLAAILCLSALATGAFAQGLVSFLNTAGTLASANGVATTGAAGTYYFGLFTAPRDSTDPLAFTFSGLYATNQTTAGRFNGGVNRQVTGWAPGETRSILVRGWSADLGHDWNPIWLTGVFPGATATSVFGTTVIAPAGVAGGFDGTANLPSLSIFGGAQGIPSGFNMPLVPEPTSLALAGLGAAAMLIFRRRK